MKNTDSLTGKHIGVVGFGPSVGDPREDGVSGGVLGGPCWTPGPSSEPYRCRLHPHNGRGLGEGFTQNTKVQHDFS